METNGKMSDNDYQVDTRDIYSIIRLDFSFTTESTETKRTILDNELRNYLAKKVSESYYNALSQEELKSLTVIELMKMLIMQIPENEQNEKISHIIHTLLAFTSYLQGYTVTWYEETNDKLINNPEIIFDEQGRWTELKTHTNTDYKTLLVLVYNKFINDVMKENEIKKEQKTKRLK